LRNEPAQSAGGTYLKLLGSSEMNQPIFTLLDEVIRAAEHCKRESRFLEDEDLFLLFNTHVRIKLGEYQAAMSRQETKRACALNGEMR